MRGFLTKDDVLKAEILWTLKLVANHYSFNSSADMAKLFSAMFPDSEIAKQFEHPIQKVIRTEGLVTYMYVKLSGKQDLEKK